MSHQDGRDVGDATIPRSVVCFALAVKAGHELTNPHRVSSWPMRMRAARGAPIHEDICIEHWHRSILVKGALSPNALLQVRPLGRRLKEVVRVSGTLVKD